MAKLEQALVLDPPAELHFKPPFLEVTTSYLNLSNPTPKDIYFKVKTTAPKTYCVRPNSGVVRSNKTVPVAVMLQPLDLDSADKSRHKFMVQSIFAPDGDHSLDTLWRDTPPEQFMNSKLKCVFDVPSEETQEAGIIKAQVTETKTTTSESTLKVTPEMNKDSQMQKLKNTNNRLKNELFDISQENSSLKEQCLRSRVAFDTKSRGTLTKQVEPKMQQATPMSQLSSSFIAVSIIVFILGVYLGKYVL